MTTIILEMANNHMGSVAHGKLIIDEFAAVVREVNYEAEYFIKFQYRELDSYLREDVKGREDLHFVKRFESTRLSSEQFMELIDHARKREFRIACTPFDKPSAIKVVEQQFDMIKIASACIDDWEVISTAVDLVQKSSSTGYCPQLTFSVGGAPTKSIDRLYAFLTHHFPGNINIMHCVAEYPCDRSEAKLGNIRRLMARYPSASIGYSAHENPDDVDVGSYALSLGAKVFEKHIGVDANGFKNNDYTIRPHHFRAWLTALGAAEDLCSYSSSPRQAELDTVRSLKRGAFLRTDKPAGSTISADDVEYRFPRDLNQLGPEDFGIFHGKYCAQTRLVRGQAILSGDIGVEVEEVVTTQQAISEIAHAVKGMLYQSGIRYAISPKMVELSHHQGFANFSKTGAVLIERINTDYYSKKILVVFPGQRHPKHLHGRKDETFELLSGDLSIKVEEEIVDMVPGDIVRVPPGVGHEFWSEGGAVVEEVATQALTGDSYYEDENVHHRKTNLAAYLDNW